MVACETIEIGEAVFKEAVYEGQGVEQEDMIMNDNNNIICEVIGNILMLV